MTDDQKTVARLYAECDAADHDPICVGCVEQAIESARSEATGRLRERALTAISDVAMRHVGSAHVGCVDALLEAYNMISVLGGDQ